MLVALDLIPVNNAGYQQTRRIPPELVVLMIPIQQCNQDVDVQ